MSSSIGFLTTAANAEATGADTASLVVLPETGALPKLRQVIASGRFTAFVNGCESTAANGYLGRLVAEVLEKANGPVFSPQARHLAYERHLLKMVAHYDSIVVAPYRVVSVATPAAAAASGFVFPVAIRSLDPSDVDMRVVNTAEELEAALPTWFANDPEAIVEEYPFPAFASAAFEESSFRVVAFGNANVTAGTVDVRIGSGIAGHAALLDKARQATLGLIESLCEGAGCVEAHYCLISAEKGFGLVNLRVDVASKIPRESIAKLVGTRPSLLYQVTFHPAMRGYHVSATRDIKAGEVVFEDERHFFPIVTKGHVDKHWSTRDQETFKRYGWPLDNEGHIYAVWQNDPRTWRPINHSCDPNLHFAATHSLNVIARRDIPAGEDLTLDYATFCDTTMEAFECFCGSAQCRKRIFPDEATLKQYGDHSWVRCLVGGAAAAKK